MASALHNAMKCRFITQILLPLLRMCVTKFVTFESDLDVCKILLLKLIHEADEAAVNWLTTYGS